MNSVLVARVAAIVIAAIAAARCMMTLLGETWFDVDPAIDPSPATGLSPHWLMIFDAALLGVAAVGSCRRVLGQAGRLDIATDSPWPALHCDVVLVFSWRPPCAGRRSMAGGHDCGRSAFALLPRLTDSHHCVGDLICGLWAAHSARIGAVGVDRPRHHCMV